MMLFAEYQEYQGYQDTLARCEVMMLCLMLDWGVQCFGTLGGARRGDYLIDKTFKGGNASVIHG